MLREAFHSHALPDDFANRIGLSHRAAQGGRRGLLDPNTPPDILIELTVRDEANRCGIPVQAVQRPGGGIVLGVARSPVDAIPRRHRIGSRCRFEPRPDMPRKFYGSSECPEPTRLMTDLQRKGANAAPRSLMSRAAALHNGADEPHF
jgi:hypothetical protein